MRYEITYKGGDTEIIRAKSILAAIKKSLSPEFITKIEVL